MPNRYHFGRKTKLIALAGFLLILFALFYQLAREINGFFDKNYLQFNRLVEIKVNSPVEVKKREVRVEEIIKVINEQPLPENLTPIESYICEKFGAYDCRVALALFRAESGLQEDAYHVNKNLSIDYGIAQINSVNWKIEGCSLREIVDPYKNIDCAYKIWDRANGIEGDKKGSFNAWVAYKNGSFASHYDN